MTAAITNESALNRLKFIFSLGTIMSAVVIGSIAAYLFYQAEHEKLIDELLFTIDRETLVLSTDVDKIRSTARQISSRSRIRQELEKYNKKEITLLQLVQFSTPKIGDVLQQDEFTLGVTRLDINNQVVFKVGENFDPIHWPENYTQDTTEVSIPFQNNNRLLVVVSNPIINREQKRVGTDLVLFNTDHIKFLLDGFFNKFDGGGEVRLSALVKNKPIHFAEAGSTDSTFTDEFFVGEIHEALALASLQDNEGLHKPETAMHGDELILHATIENSPWVLFYLGDHEVFSQPARKTALYTFSIIMLLGILSLVILRQALNPLTRQIMQQTHELHDLLHDKTNAEKQLSRVIDLTPNGMMIVNHQGVITEANIVTTMMFGYSRDKIVGMSVEQLMPDDLRKNHQELRNGYLKKPESRIMSDSKDLYALNAEGKTFPVEIGLAPVSFNNEQQVLVTIIDVTERKAYEKLLHQQKQLLKKKVEERTEELKRSVIKAEEANQAKSQFLANMSHELRTPMHAIISFANLGLKKTDDEKLLSYLENIDVSGRRLTRLLNDLLDLAKLEAGKMEMHFIQKDLIKLINHALAELDSLIKDKQLDIRINAPGEVLITVDSDRILQVLNNIFSNAIKFSTDQGIIEIKVTEQAPEVLIEISDHGVGIPADELEHVFEKFSQSSATKTKAGGTGLGLAICDEIVHAHQGSISAISPLPDNTQGTMVKITLPGSLKVTTLN